MSTVNIRLYDILRKELNLSDEKARNLTETIEQVVKDEVKADSNEYKSIFKADFKDLDTKFEKEISKVEVKIEQSKSDMVKWFVSLFVALALMIIGLYIKK